MLTSEVKLKLTKYTTIIVVLSCYLIMNSFYKIETSQKGVVVRLGSFHNISNEGPNFKLPLGIDRVYKVSVTRVHELQFGFRKALQLSPQQKRLESLMLTGDLNVAYVEWTLQYKITEPQKYLFNAKNVEKNIRDTSISVMRRVVGDKLVEDVLTTDRILIANSAKQLTQESIDKYDMGILITKINLQNVTPPERVKPAFNEVNIAKQEGEQMINKAKEMHNKMIPEELGKAKKIEAESEAYAYETINNAKGKV